MLPKQQHFEKPNDCETTILPVTTFPHNDRLFMRELELKHINFEQNKGLFFSTKMLRLFFWMK